MGSLDRGLDALELLAERGAVKLVDVAAELGVSRATAHRLLAVLQARGYVEHLLASHAYRLGPAAGDLAARADHSSLPSLAAPALAELRALTGETVNLAVLRRGRIVWADTVEARYAIRLTTTLGEVVPAHATAIGKAILSALPTQEWVGLLGPEPYPELTAATRTSLAALTDDVDAARTTGFAIDDGESEVGGVCFAAAILGRTGQPVGAISVSGVEVRLPATAARRIGPEVRLWCDEISARLQHPGTGPRNAA
jgi:IclR family acetate operon transcriptional repressor